MAIAALTDWARCIAILLTIHPVSARALYSCFSGALGGITTTRNISIVNQLHRSVKQWFPDSAIKAFPNPVMIGQLMNVQLLIPKPGTYVLRISAADGKLMHMRPLQIVQESSSSIYPFHPTMLLAFTGCRCKAFPANKKRIR